MSLIKCDECGKEISNKSSVCIYCGNPIYKEEHTNVVLLERSWIDLSDEEKISLICEYEEKSGVSFRYYFFDFGCSFWYVLFSILGLRFLIHIFFNVNKFDSFVSWFVSLLFFLFWVSIFGILAFKTWEKKRKQINWYRVNNSKDFNKWLKSSKNIVKW